MVAGQQAARHALLTRLGALTGREEAISRHLRGEDGRNEADFGDVANFTAADEVLEGLEEAALREIGEIRAALERMDAGSWGECETCGADIGARRLEVLPHARQCVTCASAET